MNILAPIFLILASVGIFYGYTNPNYRGENVENNIMKLKAERSQYREALDRSNELIALRNKLVEVYNNIPSSDLERLKKLLPDHIDNVRLVIDVDSIAAKYGLNISGIEIEDDKNKSDGPESSKNLYGTLTLKFKINAPYEKFRFFIKDLQQSLRIVDIVGISFKTSDKDTDEYEVTIKTYWIK